MQLNVLRGKEALKYSKAEYNGNTISNKIKINKETFSNRTGSGYRYKHKDKLYGGYLCSGCWTVLVHNKKTISLYCTLMFLRQQLGV